MSHKIVADCRIVSEVVAIAAFSIRWILSRALVKTTLVFSRLHMWNVRWERFSVYLARYLTMPKNLATSACSFGVVNSTMGFTLAESGFKSLAVSRPTRNVNFVTAIWHFTLLGVTLCVYKYRALSLPFVNVILCQFPKSLCRPRRFPRFSCLRTYYVLFCGIFQVLTISQTAIFGIYILFLVL